MSTKIYNGLVFRDKSMKEVKKILNEYKTKNIDILKKSLNQNIAKIYYAILDDTYGRKKKFNNVLEFLNEEINYKKESIKKGYREPDLDMSMIFMLKENNGSIYGSFFVENEEASKNILEELGAEEFMYYNNTDKPDDLSNTAWRRREQKWDELFDGKYSFKDSNFEEVILINGLDFFENFNIDFEMLKDFSLEKRKNKYLINKTVEYAISKLQDEGKEFKVSDYLKFRTKYKNKELEKEKKIVSDFFDSNYLEVTNENFKTLEIMVDINDS